MKNLLLIAVASLALLTSGCATRNMARLMQSVGNDPATFRARITTIYGTVEVTRTNPGTNTLVHSMRPDGSVTVGSEK